MSNLVSIVMPVRNALPYLKECLDSILHQTHTHWELLAVNDHSDDDSFAILEQYALRDHRIQCFQNAGRGIIPALNKGHYHAKGKFITRMDADDIMPSMKLESMLDILTEVGNGCLSTGKIKYISETVLGRGFLKYEAWLNGLCDRNNHYGEIYKECVIPSPCWMMYQEDFEKIGAFHSNTYPEDYDLCFRMYENGIKVIPSDEVLHIWRDHGGRASRNDDNYSDNRFLDLKMKYFLRNELDSNRKLILWGAGKKGKYIAKLLLENKVKFQWITNNKKKVDKDIYGQKMSSPEWIHQIGGKIDFIIAVANEQEQETLFDFINQSVVEQQIFKFC